MEPQTLADLAGEVIPTEWDVGVRVLIRIRYDNGATERVEVTVNAPPDALLNDVIQGAIDFVERGGLNRRGRRKYATEVMAAGVKAVVVGGIERPAITVR